VVEVKFAMSGRVKFALAALAIAVFALAFAGEAQAKPEWLGLKLRKWSIVRTGNDPGKAGKGGYYSLHLEITHSNNSDDRVITRISDKYGTMTLVKKEAQLAGNVRTTVRSTIELNSAKVNEVELTPGESITLIYDLRITDYALGVKGYDFDWEDINKQLGKKGWTLTWNYDCSVKSRKEEVVRRK
jgi:hypothetical protein